MEILPYSILLILLVGIAIWFFLVRQKSAGDASRDSQATMLLGQNMDNLRRELNEQLHKINEKMRRSMVDVRVEQTKANEATRQMVTIAEELQSLQDILKNPKQRGILG